MFDLIFAAMLAQVTPAADVSPGPSATAVDTPGAAATPASVTFPRGPRRMPMDVPSMSADDVLIRNSGSTNAAGYAIVVHRDFTADFSGQQKTIAAPQAKWLYAKIAQAKPFAQLGAPHCMKSASFGSVTTITYEGETTPDLSCPGGPESRELIRTIGVIVNQLGINTRPGSRLLRL